MAGKRTLAAGTTDIGAGSDGQASLMIVQVANLTGSVAFTGRITGSGMTRAPLTIVKRADDSALVSIVAAGIYEVDIAGLDVAIVVTTGPADVAYTLVTGA